MMYHGPCVCVWLSKPRLRTGHAPSRKGLFGVFVMSKRSAMGLFMPLQAACNEEGSLPGALRQGAAGVPFGFGKVQARWARLLHSVCVGHGQMAHRPWIHRVCLGWMPRMGTSAMGYHFCGSGTTAFG